MFIAPPNHKLVMADYSQAELRVAAHCSNEPAWIYAFLNGADIHAQTAKQVFSLDCDVHEVAKLFKESRNKAKTVNFGIIYGMSEYGLAQKLGMEIDEAREFIGQYFGNLPVLEAWIQEVHAFAIREGYVVNPFGRKRRLPEIQLFIPPRLSKPRGAPFCWGRRQEAPPIIRTFYQDFNFENPSDMQVFTDVSRMQTLAHHLAAKQPRFQKCTGCPLVSTCVYEVERSYRQSKVNEAKRQSVNAIVQSGASDMTTSSFSKILLVCRENGIPISLDTSVPGIRPWNIIHDENVYVVHDSFVEPVTRIIKDVMMNIFPACSVPMAVDFEVVQRLSDKHDAAN